jgi:hypothetical protein
VHGPEKVRIVAWQAGSSQVMERSRGRRPGMSRDIRGGRCAGSSGEPIGDSTRVWSPEKGRIVGLGRMGKV